MIKTSKHETRFCNTEKLQTLKVFINEYRRVADLIITDIWNNGYKEFSIQNNNLYMPKYINYRDFEIKTTLTARAISTLTTQLSGVIRAETEKQRKRIYMFEKLKQEGASKVKLKSLITKMKQNIPVKPDVSKLNPELSSNCCKFVVTNGKYLGFIKLSAILKDETPIYVPIKGHKHSKKMSSMGTRMNSFLINEKYINVRWSIDAPQIKTQGCAVGADQGLTDLLTFSDGQVTCKTDNHGHSLKTILEKMCKKKKGSKAFKRSQDHRNNFVNWSINNLNLDNINEIKLEDIKNIGFKSSRSRILSHWTNTLIRDKVISICELNGVRLTPVKSPYRSQRCSVCSMVCKSNRKGKIYNCRNCGFIEDADLNASKNLLTDLPEIPYNLQKSKINRSGFFWKEDGFFDLTGRHLEFLPPVEDKSL